jgi:hypothetical protein
LTIFKIFATDMLYPPKISHKPLCGRRTIQITKSGVNQRSAGYMPWIEGG